MCKDPRVVFLSLRSCVAGVWVVPWIVLYPFVVSLGLLLHHTQIEH